MNNLTDTLEYKEADHFEFSASDRLRFLGKSFIVFLNVSLLLLFEFFHGILNLFTPSRKTNVNGQLCLVTGGANGLGRYLALRFAEEGCNIAIVDIMDSDHTVMEIVNKFNVKCHGFVCDVSDMSSIDKMRQQVEASMGTIDILVNNAGLLFSAPFLHSNIESIQKCVDVNLVSHFKVRFEHCDSLKQLRNFKMVKTFLPGMIARKRGRIVAISSMTAKMTLPMSTIYSATKFGVDGFMEALFDDLCLDDYDEFIKLTTTFPYFINTRKELGDLMDDVEDLVPRMSAKYVADVTVKGVLLTKRKIVITPTPFHLIVQ